MSDNPKIAKPTLTATLNTDWLAGFDRYRPLRNPMADLRTENERLYAEIARIRLTDDERKAISHAEGTTNNCDVAAVLRRLLERMK